MNILAVGAHPDDIEFGCAPLLLAESERGARISLLVLSRGEAGTAGTPESREAEARAAAKLMGAEIEFLDFGGDCRIVPTPENGIRIAATLRRLQPELVLAPHPEPNQHPDHAAVGRMTRNACRLARYGGLAELRHLAPHRVDNLLFYQITGHGRSAPDVVFDIGAQMARWEAVMRCHASQVATKRYVELQTTTARMLGLTAGCEYALGLWQNDPIRLERLSEIRFPSRVF